MSRRLIITSVGTSLLTRHAEKEEREALTRCANSREGDCPNDITAIISQLHDKALNQLKSSDVGDIRRASAELNGLIGICNGRLPSGHDDMHFLIATDTAQGKATAKAVKEYLSQCGCIAEIFTPCNLSTCDASHFSEGVKALLKWCDETIDGYRKSGYEIVFNLTGGFKSLQGYLNTIGMFYADRIIYIFESASSELIEIPQLPITIDHSVFKSHAVEFALLDAGKEFGSGAFSDVPASLLDELDGKLIFSVWGELMWAKSKKELLSRELLPFPFLSYDGLFVRDFNQNNIQNARVKLQETLAKISKLLEQANGSTGPLKSDGGLQYEDYNNHLLQGKPIGHIRVTQDIRISCVAEKQGLLLRHYGAHDYVNDNP